MKLQHFLLLVLICVIWGFNFVAAKVGVIQLPPLLFTGLRFLLLAVVLIPFLKPAEGRMTDVLRIAFFNGPLHFGLMFTGVSLAAASVVAVVAQLMVPFATILSIVMLGEVVHADAIGWSALLFTAVGASLIGHNIYFWLLQRYEVSLIAPISLLSPILGVVFGVLVLHEPLSTRLVVGATIAFAGVAVLAFRGRAPVETAA